MPIQVNFTEQLTGINAATSYWVINFTNMDNNANVATIYLDGYNSLASKTAGKRPLHSAVYVATFAQLGITGATTITQLVTAIYNYCITATENVSGTVLLAGGTIV